MAASSKRRVNALALLEERGEQNCWFDPICGFTGEICTPSSLKIWPCHKERSIILDRGQSAQLTPSLPDSKSVPSPYCGGKNAPTRFTGEPISVYRNELGLSAHARYSFAFPHKIGAWRNSGPFLRPFTPVPTSQRNAGTMRCATGVRALLHICRFIRYHSVFKQE